MSNDNRSRLAGKVALVSGAAKGQGAVHARVLAEQGAQVVLGDILDDAGQAHAESLRADGLAVTYTHLNVTRAADWDAAVTLAETAYGHLDVLVNNAGIASYGNVCEEREEDWDQVIAVNQTGTWFGMRAVVPAMRRAGRGSIVNVSSTLGVQASASAFAYHATKGAVRMMTRGAALTLCTENIRVNCIVIGLVDTDFVRPLREAGVLAARLDYYPMHRLAQPEEISQGVVYLASEESSYVTGVDFVMDGGLLAGFPGRLTNMAPARVDGIHSPVNETNSEG